MIILKFPFEINWPLAIKHFVIFYNIKRKYVLENDCQCTISFRFKLEPAARNSALGYARTATAVLGLWREFVRFIAKAIKHFVILYNIKIKSLIIWKWLPRYILQKVWECINKLIGRNSKMESSSSIIHDNREVTINDEIANIFCEQL